MTRSTDAAILVELGKPLEVVRLTIPELRSAQVLVDVTYSGVCHSQLHEARGRRGPDRFLPHTLGHEGAGTVIEVGPGVTKVKPGDRVVLTWIKGEGADITSTVYTSGPRKINSGAISSLMRQTVTCENRVVPVCRDMPLREAALLGCAIPTGMGIVLKTAGVRPGMSVAVFGVGGIGLSAVVAASLVASQPIIAVDIHDHKLDQARRVGATHTVNAREAEPVSAILQLTGSRGVDIAVEAAGCKETMEAAHASVKDNGGLCVIAGNLAKGERFSVDPMDLIRGKQLVGTWGGETRPDEDIPVYARLYLEGKLRLNELITHTYCLEEVNQAFDDLENGKVGRALIYMGRDLASPP